jgi:hypothetical protein
MNVNQPHKIKELKIDSTKIHMKNSPKTSKKISKIRTKAILKVKINKVKKNKSQDKKEIKLNC